MVKAVSPTVSAYFSLHPRLQKNIVSRLGWKQLRPVQEMAIPPLLKGHDAVILAPTAGGKTESALFPLLSNMVDGKAITGPQMIYLCPLKALINNLLHRLQKLAGLVNREAFSWHGEVSHSQRQRFLREPKSILLTTPESLQVILSRPNIDPGELFANLQSVVIDEVHAFCGTSRGDQLSALLSQLDHWRGSSVQRVGLSATVGNPEELLQWLSGDRDRPHSLVDPAAQGAPKQPKLLEVHPVGQDVEECSRLAAALMKDSAKSLLFVDSRRQAEAVQNQLCRFDIEALSHHSSLSQEMREKTEEAFRSSQRRARKPQAIVCTSTLELGLDVGDIEKVFQLGAPSTVSAFLQRLGRAGRREDSVAHMVFVTDQDQSFLQALALIRLAIDKRVEPVIPNCRSFPVLVQQILLNVLRAGALSADKLWALLEGCAPFEEISQEERHSVLQHLVSEEWLLVGDGRLTIGPRSEKEFGRSNYMELLSVFNGTSSVKVQTEGGRPLGTIDFGMADSLARSGQSFLLGGGSWKAKRFDKFSQTLVVTKSVGGQPLRWSGGKRELSAAVVRATRDLLLGTEPVSFLGKRANARLQQLRAEHTDLEAYPTGGVSEVKGQARFRVEQWAGVRVHRTLAAAVAGWLGTDYRCDDHRWIVEASEQRVKTLLSESLQRGNWSEFCLGGLAAYRGRHLNSVEMPKFSHLLPVEVQEELARGGFYAVAEAEEYWAELRHLQ